MSMFDNYLIHTTEEITGDRTQAEEHYDNEVIKWLTRGVDISEAISKANTKYPDEALQIDSTNIDAVAAHYDYLKEHLEIKRIINLTKNRMK